MLDLITFAETLRSQQKNSYKGIKSA